MLSVHNTHMYLKTMSDARAHLAAGTFGEFYREFIAGFKPSEKKFWRSGESIPRRLGKCRLLKWNATR